MRELNVAVQSVEEEEGWCYAVDRVESGDAGNLVVVGQWDGDEEKPRYASMLWGVREEWRFTSQLRCRRACCKGSHSRDSYSSFVP